MGVELHTLTPQTGQLAIDVHLSATINVTAFSAKQKVTGFVVDEISTNMHGGEPRLIIDERICWRVPVILSLPPTGDSGNVGAIDVDIETGQLIVTHKTIQDIKRHAHYLATYQESSTA